jgi:uncharacterized protein YceH (UPF0502 family)
VLGLDEESVQEAVDELIKKHLITEKTGFGSRVTKFKHRFCNTEFGSLKFSGQELGVVCELLLRGPQTPGELRTHTNRLCRFQDVDEVETTLEGLMDRKDGPFVVRLPREPGKRESRYAHLFSGEVEIAAMVERVGLATAPVSSARERIDGLEARLSELSQELDELKRQVEQLRLKEAAGNG